MMHLCNPTMRTHLSASRWPFMVKIMFWIRLGSKFLLIGWLFRETLNTKNV
jgi:hypothetical protein